MAKLFDRWWHNFIQWTIIVIPLLFFMWLAGVFVSIDCTTLGGTTGLEGPTGEQIESEFENIETEIPVCEMMVHLLALGALFAGIVISLSSSAAGAKQVINMSKKAGKKALNYGKQKGYEAGRRGVGKEDEKGVRKYSARGLGKAGQRLQTVPGLKTTGIAMQRPAQRWAEQYKKHQEKLKDLNYDQTKGLLYGRDDMALAAWKKLAQDPKPENIEKLQKDFTDDPKLRAAFERNLAKSDIRKDDSMKEAKNLFPVDTAQARARTELKRELTKKAVAEGGGKVAEPTEEQIQAKIKQKKQKAEQSKEPNEYDEIIGKMDAKQLAALDARQLASEDVIEAIRKSGKETSGFLQSIAVKLDKAQAYSKTYQRIKGRNVKRDMEKIRTTDSKTYEAMQNLQRDIAEGQASARRGEPYAAEGVKDNEKALLKLFFAWQEKNAPASQVGINLKATPGFAAILESSKMGRKDVIELISKEMQSSQQNQSGQGKQTEQPKEENK